MRVPQHSLPRVLIIAAGGGHLTEAFQAIQDVPMDRIFVTFKLPHSDQTLGDERRYYVIDPHKEWWKFILNGFQSLYIMLRTWPHAIINTGGGISIACSLIGKMIGTKLIFIESGARVTSPSATGRFLYKYADLFIVQWEPLLKYYPKAIYGGPLL